MLKPMATIAAGVVVGVVSHPILRSRIAWPPTADFLSVAAALVTMIAIGITLALTYRDTTPDGRNDGAAGAGRPAADAVDASARHTSRNATNLDNDIDLTDPACVKEQRRNIALFAERKHQAQIATVVMIVASVLGLMILVTGFSMAGGPANTMWTILALLIGGVVVAGICDARLRCPHCAQLRNDEDADMRSIAAWRNGRCPNCNWFVSLEALERERRKSR